MTINDPRAPLEVRVEPASFVPGPQGPKGDPGATGPQGPAGDPTQFELRGSGPPEGAVAAPVGSYYTDTAATRGAIRWVKQTGSGNTGWRVLWGDTGWRGLVPLLLNGWTTAVTPLGCRIRRINDTLIFGLVNLNPVSATSDTILDHLGEGWNAATGGNGLQITPGWTNTFALVPIYMQSSGTTNVFRVSRVNLPSGTVFVNALATYSTIDPWPTSLP